MTQSVFQRFCAVAGMTMALQLLAASNSAAQTPDAQELISKADTDADGNLSWEEILAFRSKSFDQLDLNRDGFISADDRPPRPFAARFNKAFERIETGFDADRDGRITKSEMMSGPAPFFETGDVNGDGVLSADEIAALSLRTKIAPE